MTTTKVLHLSDLHYCGKHLAQVDAAVAHAIDEGIAANCRVAILSGDQFDTAVSLHEPAVDAFFHRIRLLADVMPVLVLQGTFSHDRPGSLAPLRKVGGKHPIYVAERITQVALNNWGQWIDAARYAFDDIPKGAQLIVSCLPSINKGAVAAAVGAENVGEKAGEMVTAVCRGWAGSNLAARAAGIPTVLVTHGTVNGAITETAHAMVSKDHEFTSGALFGAETSAVMVGHIHRRQQWEHQGRRIAYPGSITKLIHGHCGDNGALLWEVRADSADFRAIDTPSRRMIELAYPGLPDMADLERAAADCAGAYIRIRYSVDEEYRASVDRAAITSMLTSAGAAEVKLEGRVNPITRVRAAGISQARSLADQLGLWCSVTNTAPEPLLERLALMEHKDDGEIIECLV